MAGMPRRWPIGVLLLLATAAPSFAAEPTDPANPGGATAPAAAAGDAPKDAAIEGTLTRAALDAVLGRGPQRFIAGLRVAPHMNGKQFVGFRIVGFAPDSPLATGASIRPGDVVLKVNGESLARPEQFMHAWERVGEKDALTVDLLRADKPVRYRWRIVP
jgi:type II secretory pathway component PulC